jgi:hypothetical protein
MNHFIPILNILIKKEQQPKNPGTYTSEFLHQASYLFSEELVAAAYNFAPQM